MYVYITICVYIYMYICMDVILAGIGLHHLPTNIEDSADPRVSISHVFTRFSTISSSDPAAWFLVLPGSVRVSEFQQV